MPTTKTAATLVSLSLIFTLCSANLTIVAAKAFGDRPTSVGQLHKAIKTSPRLVSERYRAEEKVPVIVETAGARSERLNRFLKQERIHIKREISTLNTVSISLPFGMVEELANFPEVLHVSTNEIVRATGHVSVTTGTDAGKTQAANSGQGQIDGSGVGIAIVDSGIDVNHVQFLTGTGASRVLASVDFTGENRVDDPYGHGTFVAAAAAGNANAGTDYAGIATGASLLNIRVLNSNGEGSVESVLAGLEWIASHARQYNIRIVNLSLGMQAVESYKYDLLCRAVRGLTNSGILVVAAAGND
ncbi:MAG TPA: S8 family serine peptidase, partial [Pyrinomonadaceae bacterium]|nr:S8 family serine peptidase [Pyrinomonadaceae bacterium]